MHQCRVTDKKNKASFPIKIDKASSPSKKYATSLLITTDKKSSFVNKNKALSPLNKDMTSLPIHKPSLFLTRSQKRNQNRRRRQYQWACLNITKEAFNEKLQLKKLRTENLQSVRSPAGAPAMKVHYTPAKNMQLAPASACTKKHAGARLGRRPTAPARVGTRALAHLRFFSRMRYLALRLMHLQVRTKTRFCSPLPVLTLNAHLQNFL